MMPKQHKTSISQTIHYTYHTFVRDMDDLAREVTEGGWMQEVWHPDLILYIPRGGAVIATHMAHLLSIKEVAPYNPSYRRYSSGKNILLVDDISDTGKTLVNVFENLSKIFADQPDVTIKTCTPWIRRGTEIIPDHYAREVVGRAWIEFPWEHNEGCSLKERVYKVLQDFGVTYDYRKVII